MGGYKATQNITKLCLRTLDIQNFLGALKQAPTPLRSYIPETSKKFKSQSTVGCL